MSQRPDHHRTALLMLSCMLVMPACTGDSESIRPRRHGAPALRWMGFLCALKVGLSSTPIVEWSSPTSMGGLADAAARRRQRESPRVAAGGLPGDPRPTQCRRGRLHQPSDASQEARVSPSTGSQVHVRLTPLAGSSSARSNSGTDAICRVVLMWMAVTSRPLAQPRRRRHPQRRVLRHVRIGGLACHPVPLPDSRGAYSLRSTRTLSSQGRPLTARSGASRRRAGSPCQCWVCLVRSRCRDGC